ncbi:MAG: 2-C-methyl-D-erythritol 2,4-cyclodiphosphate synthase [Magnetococcus sp. DMHC-6]
MNLRIGQGFDVHPWCTYRPLILGGVHIPHPQGLLGHSDADVLLHAIMDALLGAAALGDIGQHFPDSDPALAGADSGKLLKQIYQILTNLNFSLVNLDATIICEKPKLAPFMSVIVANMAAILQVEPNQINIKATTTEKLGFTGRNEGVAAMAVVLIQKNS